MSVVRINAIDVPAERGAELEARFAARANEVATMEGFEGFQLLRPTEGEDRYFVVTWWESEAAFQAWITSESFARGHARPGGDQPGHGGPAHGGAGHGGPAHGAEGGAGQPGPVARGATLLSFDVALAAGNVPGTVEPAG